MIHNISRYLLTLVALLAMTAGAWAGTRATGSFENCTGHNGSIHVHGWAYDPDASATSINVHAYIWYGESVGSTKEQRLPIVGIMADLERADVNTAKGITGNHGFNKYIAVPAGTYTVQIFAIDQNGDGNPPIPGPTSGTNYQTYTITVDAPFTVSFDANGGSDAPANQDKCTGIDLKLSSDQPVREGYIFVGWNTAQDGSGDSYKSGATYTANADLTLYAQWLKVTLDENSIVATMEKMPAFDVTVDYELVRDMTVDVDATIADRIRIQKENNAYVAVTATELFPAVSDKISGTAVAMTATTDYTAQLQKKTEGDNPTWADATTLSVGTFRYVITGTGLYDGKITTNEFQLFEGYEVTIPAGEYATYFKDEALYVENENAQLYTISSVTESEAVLSDAITVAPANTPLLVYNKSQTETLTFLLIPTTDKTPDEVTAATQFVGTLVATTIPASATGADNYALNGYAFVWVKTAIEVGANKCWLHIASQPAAARAMTRSIVGGNGTTGIDAIEKATIDNEGWYDLQGRKLQAKPNRGGIYIHNGKKVVVRK